MSERLRILVTTDAVGGVWTYSLDLAAALAQLEVEAVLAVTGPSPNAAQETAAKRAGVRLVDTGLPLDWVAHDPAAAERAGRAVAELSRATGVDLVQLNSPALGADVHFPVPTLAVQHSCVATWWDAVHGTDLPEDFEWRTERVRAGLEAANAVVTPTAAFGQAVMRRYRLDRAPAPIHNGRAPLRIASAAPHDFAFTAGRLWDAGKNVATLDAAAASIGVPVHAAGPSVGPNGARAAFDHLHCLGELGEEEIAAWLARRPVFVSAALYEPFGLAALEAAMAGCPLVLSDIPTFRELWDGAAVFVPATDEDAFARVIADLVGDDFARASLGRDAKERARRYTLEAMATRMARLYRRLVSAEPLPDPESEVEAKAAA